MGTILPMARTTACLTLSLLNDEGLVAFCESDFVIIPAGILLHHLSGRPVFLHNSTFPHDGLVTCAHCTAPRRMDGARYFPARVLTHYESEYGAAPKVEIPKGQVVTCLDPEYAAGRWVGILGTVEDNPFYEICRSQQDVRVRGNWRKLLREVRDSHWVLACGDLLKEAEYAARRIGVAWDSVLEG
jgi:L-fucose isomerase-like protein